MVTPVKPGDSRALRASALYRVVACGISLASTGILKSAARAASPRSIEEQRSGNSRRGLVAGRYRCEPRARGLQPIQRDILRDARVGDTDGAVGSPSCLE